MKIEITHRFDATHQHMTPRGMSEPHAHSWVWTVVIEGPVHPVYGWVADFDAMRQLLAAQTVAHFEGTAERFLVHMITGLALALPSGLTVTCGRLEEQPGQAAIWEHAGDEPCARERGGS